MSKDPLSPTGMNGWEVYVEPEVVSVIACTEGVENVACLEITGNPNTTHDSTLLLTPYDEANPEQAREDIKLAIRRAISALRFTLARLDR